MDATSFQFSMTMPGDARLIETVGELTAHAAKYAELAEPDARALVEQVVAAAVASSTAAAPGVLALSFQRTPVRFDVAIEWDGQAPSGTHDTPTDAPTSVHWSHRGDRQRCLVSHIARL